MKKITAVILLIFIAMPLIAQDDLLPAGKDGLKKRSWVLLNQTVTVRGERTIEVPDSVLAERSFNYVAFYIKDKLIAIDEIPPFKVTYDFGKFTRKAKILAVGVKYVLQQPEAAKEQSAVQQAGAESTVQPAADQAEQSTSFDISAYDLKITAPSEKQYAYGNQKITVATNLPPEMVLRIDFQINERDVGSVGAPPYELEYDFGKGFNALRIKAIAVLKNGLQLDHMVNTKPLEGSDYYIRTKLVTLDASVLDYKDRFIGGLERKDFRIFEDGKQVEVTHFTLEERPVRVALLIDSSGSMQQRGKMKWAKNAATQFLSTLKPDKDKAALIAFTDLVNPLSAFTNDFEKLSSIIGKIEPVGGTAINDALNEVVPMFKDEYGRKAIVLLTDGQDQHSNVDISEAIENVKAAGIKVYSIGLFDNSYFTRRIQNQLAEKTTLKGKTPDFDPTDARKKKTTFTRGSDTRTTVFEGISDETGGTAFFPQKVEQLPRIFKQISDELRNMYTLGYIPENKSTRGKWREIKVEVDKSGATVRTKRGYYEDKK
jgi:Ca-activated chloride channel family protein